jgi:hypothetical protein
MSAENIAAHWASARRRDEQRFDEWLRQVGRE